MMKKYRYTYIYVALMILLALTLLVGCTSKKDDEPHDDDIQLKDELLMALNKDMGTFHFAGEAKLWLDWPALTGQNLDPLTASMTSALTNGEIAWQGIADLNTSQLEVDLNVRPNEFPADIAVPIIVNNNKLYIQIPLLAAADDEFLTFALDGKVSGSPFTSLLRQVVTALDEAYFEALPEDETPQTTIQVNITKDNVEHIAAAFELHLPGFINEMEQNGLLSHEQAEQWRIQLANRSESLIHADELDAPGHLSFTINEEGYVSAQSIAIFYANQSLEFQQSLTQINEAVTFTKPIPQHTRSIEEMMEQWR